jgi:hypothetical protein
MRDIFEIMTKDEIAKLKQTHDCPICGFEFVGYPTGWTWEIHIRGCLTEIREDEIPAVS